MREAPYLLRLSQRLRQGLEDLDPQRCRRHRDFIFSRQLPNGGFSGRDGVACLQKTSCALRSLDMLKALDRSTAEDVFGYLDSWPLTKLSVADLCHWLVSALIVQECVGKDRFGFEETSFGDAVTACLESTRTSDGGYARTSETGLGSTQHSFQVLQTYQLMARPLPRPQALLKFLQDRRREDGGFVEISPMRSSSTNSTVAAALLLLELNALGDADRLSLGRFLSSVQTAEGGYRASARIAFADGISTFAATLLAADLRLPQFEASRTREWVSAQLERPSGGFRATPWDDEADVEYTCYGLASLSLLEVEAARIQDLEG